MSLLDVKAVLFDFGGTIDTDGVHWSEKFWEHYQKFNLNVQKADFERAFVKADEQLMGEQLSHDSFKDILDKQLSAQFAILGLDRSMVRSMGESCYEDVVRTIGRAKTILLELASTLALGVVSNFYGNLEKVLREFGMDSLFSTFVDSAVVGVRKPDPRIFQMALTSLGVLPAKTIVVGDSYERDIVPSRLIGCKTIWLRGKSWITPVETKAADFIVTRFEDIRSIILG